MDNWKDNMRAAMTPDGIKTVGGGAGDGQPSTGATTTIGGTYNETPPTYTDGDVASTQMDANGNTKVREQYAPGYEDNDAQRALVEQRNNYTYISTATTTTAKNGAGFLHKIVVSGGTAGTIAVYDNTAGSGQLIASFDSTDVLASYEFNCIFATGLTIVTGAATKVTAVWR